MKTREQIKRIREGKGLIKKLVLAMDDPKKVDSRPSTLKHGQEIWNLLDWLRSQEICTFDPESKHNLDQFGMRLARAVRDGNSALFRHWADAIDEWHNYKSNSDPLRAAILTYVIFHGSKAELAKPFSKRTYQVRDIVAYLKSQGMDKGAHTARIVYRICHELGIKIHGTPGHPKTSAK